MTTKTFDLGHVVSISNGRLLCKMEGVYEILNWMTEDNLFTHQLPRAFQECKPWLLRWFPELEALNLPSPMAALDRLIELYGPEQGCATWIAEQPGAYPQIKSSYEVPRIPRDDHEFKDPVDELVEMVGIEKVITVETIDVDISGDPELN